MDITKVPKSALSRIHVLGQAYEKDRKQHALWRLDGNTSRVPGGIGKFDGDTPGVHSLRALAMSSKSRKLLANNVQVDFLDPLLMDLFANENNKDSTFDFKLQNLSATVVLRDTQRVLVAPVRATPSRTAGEADQLYVPPYWLVEGVLAIDSKKSERLENLLPDWDRNSAVELDRDGIVYNANVKPPDPPDDQRAPISTTVRLAMVDGMLTLTLLPRRQSEPSQARWREVWRSLQATAALTRKTAWARLNFEVGDEFPALRWPIMVKDEKATMDWGDIRLPAGLATLTLADQPVESQLLGPQQVLMLLPEVTLSVKGDKLTVKGEAGELENSSITFSYAYVGNLPEPSESIAFPDTMPMVHQPTQVYSALQRAYAPLVADKGGTGPLTGFMKEADGWVEIPFHAPASETGKPLPGTQGRVDSPNARGSLLIGLRRQALYQPGDIPEQAPWSVRVDEPEKYSFELEFSVPKEQKDHLLKSIKIDMQGSAIQTRGLVWLANRKPDENDALPVVDDHPSAFFDIVLNRADVKTNPEEAPFVLHDFRLIAPSLPNGGWDSVSDMRSGRRPGIDAGYNLQLNLQVLDPKNGSQRLWTRHPTLPSIQTMPLTRSDTASSIPHASRALFPLDSKNAGTLTFTNATSLAPRLIDKARKTYTFKTQADNDASLVALSLPGIELIPTDPLAYSARGSYGLPLLDEVYARATLPPSDSNATLAIEEPRPVVTALQKVELEAMWRELKRKRALTKTQNSVMFVEGKVGEALPLVANALLEPRKWDATATVNTSVTCSHGKLEMGSVTFKQSNSGWVWTASGNKLLAGVSAKLNVTKKGVLTLAPGKCGLVGWSAAERLDEKLILDGRGVGWTQELKVETPAFLKRTVKVELEGGNSELRTLVSTHAPLGVSVKDSQADWRFAFTDVPFAESGHWMPENNPQSRFAALEHSWTWCLYGAKDTLPQSLLLNSYLGFSPAALTNIKLTDDKTGLASVRVEGSLTLGVHDTRLINDTRCRIALTLEPAGAGLAIKNVELMGGAAGRISWDLASMDEVGKVISGVPRLSAKLGFKDRKLTLDDVKLDFTALSSSTVVKFGKLSGTSETIKNEMPPHVDQVGHLAVTVSLAEARVTNVELAARLRNGVDISVKEDISKNQLLGTLSWFGNDIATSAFVDGARRAIGMTISDDSTPVTVFPDVIGQISSGAVCLTVDTLPDTNSMFKVVTHFSELMFDAGVGLGGAEKEPIKKLKITHLFYKASNNDSYDGLRFDGLLRSGSLITWPDVEVPKINDDHHHVLVDFGATASVTHNVDFILADHRIDGKAMDVVTGGKGVTLNQPATWVVEGTHTLTWSAGARHRMQCMHTLQLWGAEKLADAVSTTANRHGFTPSYRGDKTPTKAFPEPGVRMIAHGYAGLPSQVQIGAIKDMGASWILLGGLTVLSPAKDRKKEFCELHLPFVGAFTQENGSATLEKLKKQLAPRSVPETANNFQLQMSRHDVLPTTIITDEQGALPAGFLAKPSPVQTIRYARASLPHDALSGHALVTGWFGRDAAEPGWHVEQIQMPGKSTTAPVTLPHPFPRATVMLAFLKPNAISDTQSTLSVLVRFVGPRGNCEVKTVQVQPRLLASSDEPPSNTRTVRDLVVGGVSSLALFGLDDAEIGVDETKRLLALTLTQFKNPSFLLERKVSRVGSSERKAFGEDLVEFVIHQMPAVTADPLAVANRPLRAETRTKFATDGRLTWPEPEAQPPLGKKMNYAMGPRTPFQSEDAALAGIGGDIQPTQVAGAKFTPATVNANSTMTDTVWLQEWDRIAFDRANSIFSSEDAAPRAADNAVVARPFAPSGNAVASALKRMDPAVWAVVKSAPSAQTYLPPLLRDVTISNRAGAMAESGGRILRTWDQPFRRDADRLQALAGTAMTRSMRLPRPMPLRKNGDSAPWASWRRTVGWYGNRNATCLALTGAWDMLAGPPAKGDIPDWCVLIGKPVPVTLSATADNQEPVWKGAVRVQCAVLNAHQAQLQAVTDKPAQIVLGLLKHLIEINQFVENKNLGAGLRYGSSVFRYAKVRLDDNYHLIFEPAVEAQSLSGQGDYVFELGLSVPMETTEMPAAGQEPVTLPVASSSSEKLPEVSFRKLVLPVVAPDLDVFALPLVRYSVFFSDPAYDQRLSRVQAITASGTVGGTPFTFWVDRPSVTLKETLALNAFGAATNAPYKIEAWVRRAGSAANFEKMQFALDDVVPRKFVPQIALDDGKDYALPISMLVDDKGFPLEVGDLLQLKVTGHDSTKSGQPAQIYLAIMERSYLAAPEALYSLIMVNEQDKPNRAWCAAHSSVPQPEGMDTHITSNNKTRFVLRRGLFKWSVTEAVTSGLIKNGPGISICKTDTTAEGMFVPDSIQINVG